MEKGNGFGEREFRTAIQPDVALAGEREIDRQHRPLRSGRTLGRRTIHHIYAAVAEERRVERGGLLGITVEPQAGRDLGHAWSVPFPY